MRCMPFLCLVTVQEQLDRSGTLRRSRCSSIRGGTSVLLIKLLSRRSLVAAGAAAAGFDRLEDVGLVRAVDHDLRRGALLHAPQAVVHDGVRARYPGGELDRRRSTG